MICFVWEHERASQEHWEFRKTKQNGGSIARSQTWKPWLAYTEKAHRGKLFLAKRLWRKNKWAKHVSTTLRYSGLCHMRRLCALPHPLCRRHLRNAHSRHRQRCRSLLDPRSSRGLPKRSSMPLDPSLQCKLHPTPVRGTDELDALSRLDVFGWYFCLPTILCCGIWVPCWVGIFDVLKSGRISICESSLQSRTHCGMGNFWSDLTHLVEGLLWRCIHAHSFPQVSHHRRP